MRRRRHNSESWRRRKSGNVFWHEPLLAGAETLVMREAKSAGAGHGLFTERLGKGQLRVHPFELPMWHRPVYPRFARFLPISHFEGSSLTTPRRTSLSHAEAVRRLADSQAPCTTHTATVSNERPLYYLFFSSGASQASADQLSRPRASR